MSELSKSDKSDPTVNVIYIQFNYLQSDTSYLYVTVEVVQLATGHIINYYSYLEYRIIITC